MLRSCELEILVPAWRFFSHWAILLLFHGLRVPFDAVVCVLHTRDEAVQSHVGRVDGAFTCEEQSIVQEASEGASEERRYHWDLRLSDTKLAVGQGGEWILTQK